MKIDFYYGNRCIGKDIDIKFLFLFFKMNTMNLTILTEVLVRAVNTEI